MTELERICEEALYKEIQDLGDGKTIVRDVATGRLLYRKVLKVYNLQVFTYLRDHKSRYVPRIESIREEEDPKLLLDAVEPMYSNQELKKLNIRPKVQAPAPAPAKKAASRPDRSSFPSSLTRMTRARITSPGVKFSYTSDFGISPKYRSSTATKTPMSSLTS